MGDNKEPFKKKQGTEKQWGKKSRTGRLVLVVREKKSESVGETVKVKESVWIGGEEGAVVAALASRKHGLQTPVQAGLYGCGWLSRWARGCSLVLLCGSAWSI